MTAPTRTSGWSSLRHRDFAYFLTARVAGGFAVQIQTVSIGWLVYDITHDAFSLGLVGLSEFLPTFVLALFTGQVADRVDRRRILLCSYSIICLTALCMLLLAISGATQVWPIYCLLVIFGTARAFSNPAGQALLPNLVPAGEFPSAVAFNSSALQIATIAGPAAGGLLYGLGAIAAFSTTFACFLLAVVTVSFISPRPANNRREKVSWTSLVAGFSFIKSRPIVFGAISLDLFAVLLGGAVALMPIYASDILKVGPWGLGMLRSMPAVGAALMALYIAQRSLGGRTGWKMLGSVTVFGIATLGFAVSENLVLSLACLFLMGASDMISVVIRNTLVQIETPDAMRGRVSAVSSVFVGASNELGAFRAGSVAALVGTVPAAVIGGVGTVVVALLWAKLFPALRKADRLT